MHVHIIYIYIYIINQLNIYMNPLRKAAALFLCSNQSPKDSNILMIKRLKNMSFGNLYVVPGGVCDPEDKLQANSNQFIQYGKITAIRQFYEETGILIYPSKYKSVEELLSKNQKEIGDTIGQIWQGNLDNIIPIIRLMTPQFMKFKRFDCLFYAAALGESVQSINLKIAKDSNHNHHQLINNFSTISMNVKQSSDFIWQKPAFILKQAMSNHKNFRLSPPQMLIFVAINNCTNIKDLTRFKQQSSSPILFQSSGEPFLPTILYGDHEYNVKNIIQQQPQSQSKNDFVQYINKSKIIINNNSYRRIQGLPFIFNGEDEKSLFQMMTQKNVSLQKSKL